MMTTKKIEVDNNEEVKVKVHNEVEVDNNTRLELTIMRSWMKTMMGLMSSTAMRS